MSEVSQIDQNAVIIQALLKAQDTINPIEKDGKPKAGMQFSYTTEGQYKEVCRKALADAGLWLVGPNVTHHETKQELARSGEPTYKSYVRLEYVLAHSSGAVWPTPISCCGEGSDVLDKGLAKAVTSANKNLLDKLFQIPKEEDASSGQSQGATPPARASAQAGPAGGAQVMAPAAAGATPPARGAGPASAATDQSAVFNPDQTVGDTFVWLEILSGKYFEPKGNQVSGAVSWQMKQPENGAVAYVSMKWDLAQQWLDMDNPTTIRGKYLCQVRSRIYNDKTYWDCDAIMSAAQAQARQGGQPVADAYQPGVGDFEDDGAGPPLDPNGIITPGD